LIANYTRLTPNAVTLLAVPLFLASAALFYHGSRMSLIAGGLLYQASFLLDTVDGKLARLNKQSSRFGGFLDLYVDTIGVFVNLFALVVGQHRVTGNDTYLVLGMIYIFLHLFQLLKKFIAGHFLGSDFKQRFYSRQDGSAEPGLPGAIKRWFARRNLSLVLFSTVEGEAVVFFLGPVSGQVMEALVLSSLLVLAFSILKAFLYLRSCLQADREEPGR
jgi:phosphatidylglycerophosphate synthase